MDLFSEACKYYYYNYYVNYFKENKDLFYQNNPKIEKITEEISKIKNDFKVKFPKRLYKYMSCDKIFEDNIKLICQKKVRYNSIKNFKDVHDFRLIIQNENILSEEDKDIVKKMNDHILGENYRVFCVTEGYDNLYLWNNYSNNHNGFCIGFSFEEPFRTNDKDKINKILSCVKMRYSCNRSISAEDFSNLLNGQPDKLIYSVNLALITKYKTGEEEINGEKKYVEYFKEKEWRFLLQNNENVEQDFDFFDSIYIGNKVSNNNRKILLETAKKNKLKCYQENNDLEFDLIFDGK